MKFDKQTADTYAEELRETSFNFELEPEIKKMAEQQARAGHEAWMRDKKAKGYQYGKEVCDEDIPLTNPNLVDFDMLSDDMKKSNIKNAESVLKILQSKGCLFVSFSKVIVYPIAKQIHDEWSLQKLAAGWTWGEETNVEKKIHRDLVPIEVLADNPELKGDIDFDISTATNIIIRLLQNDTFVLVTDLLKFGIDRNSLQ